MKIRFHRNFDKKFKMLPRKVQNQFHERLMIFEKDEFNPTLNNHALIGKYKGYRSFNVTGDLRAVFKRDSERAIFVKVDSHSNLYG